MAFKKDSSKDKNVINKEDKIQTSLKLINNIQFTNREIDIIAYLLGGRATKKIAAFLDISPKTVENHIRNIMLKLECNSRDSIIDFIEKTDKFTLIKKHYSDLLINMAFQQELKKISAEISKNNLKCLIFHHKTQGSKDPLIDELEKYLDLAGIKTFSKIWEQGKANAYFTNNANAEQINCVIYNMSNEIIEQLKAKDYDLGAEVYNLASSVKTCPIVFLLADDQYLPSFQQKAPTINALSLAKQENDYLLILQILQNLLPNNNINKNIIEFKKQFAIFIDSPSLQQKSHENSAIHLKFHKHYKRTLVLGSIMFLLLLVFLGVAVYKLNVTKEKKSSEASEIIPKSIDNNLNTSLKSGKNETTLNLPILNFKFPERDNILTKIKDQFNILSEKQTNNLAIQVISGIGGIGKTQLAITFALQAEKENSYDTILWITATTNDSINTAYKIFANHFKIDTNELSLIKIQTLVHMKLAEKYKNKKILLVLDKTNNSLLIKKYIETLRNQLAPYTTSHILITSTSQNWEVEPLILDVFTPEKAAEFIKIHLPNEKAEAIANLGKSLNYFPLALSQAIAYIKTHSNIDDYLEAYADKKADYLNISVHNSPHVESLWKTWNIALSKLSNNARRLLYISAYLDPDNIPLELFKNLTAEERMLAIGELRKHSFITLNHNNKSFKIHKLLQEVIRSTTRKHSHNTYINAVKNKLFGTEPWLTNALDLMEHNFDFNYLQTENWKVWEKHLTNARIVAEHAIAANDADSIKLGIKLYAKVAMFMTHILIESEDSSDIWLKLISLLEKNHTNNPLLIARINTYLSVINRLANKDHDAKIYLDKALAIYSHPPTKITKKETKLLNNLRLIPLANNVKLSDSIKYDLGYTLTQLGIIYNTQGKYDEAILAYNKALVIFNEIKHVDTVKYNKVDTLYNLGRVLMFSNKFNLAERPLKTAKKITDQIYVGHQQQALAYKALASFNSHIGDFKAANELFMTSYHIVSSLLPKKHYLQNIIKINLGSNAYMLGDIKSAKAFLKQGLSYKNIMNSTQQLLLGKLYLGRIYESENKYEQATTLLKEGVLLAEEDHKKTLFNYNTLQVYRAEFWQKIKSSNTAYWQTALALTSRLFGANHYQTSRYHCLLGQAFANKGQQKQALEQYALAIAILKAEPINHPKLVKFQQQNLQLVEELARQ